MSIRSLSIYLPRSNYCLQFASLCRLTSRRGYSIDVDKPPAETQANNIQTHASANGLITNNESSSTDTKRSSFANRRKANREIQPVQQNSVPSPSSMLRTWEKSEKRLPLNFIDIRNSTDPFMRSHQNALVSKLPISATRRDIEMLTRGIFPDHEDPINKICIIYNDYYKPTGSAWIQFNNSKNALLFTKCINQKTFYGNKLSVELKRYIPEETQTDPLNYYADKCVILAGLPWDVNEHYLVKYIREICDKNFKTVNITSRTANPSDTSKWLLLLNSIADSYYMFSKIHNRYFDEVYQVKARVVK